MTYLKTFTTILISAWLAVAAYGKNHKDLLKVNAELAHILDKLYYDAGTKVDIVIFDLKELKRQGKKYPDELMQSALEADKQLRSKWLTLDKKRVELWNNYSRADKAFLRFMSDKLSKLQKDVDDFGKFSLELAEKINKETATLRTNLRYDFRKPQKNWWSKNFIRGLDLSYKIYGINRLKYPGNYMNMEYAAKASYDLNLNLLSIEILDERQGNREKILKTFDDYCGTPFLLWGSDTFFQDKDCVSFKYYGDRERLKRDVLKYISKHQDYKFFTGIQLDEPTISDYSGHYGKLLDVKGIKEAYKKYIDKRRTHLKSKGIKATSVPFTRKPKNANERALYIEWQMFKKQFMADHYKWFFEMMLDQGKFASTVIINRNFNSPQDCSYVSMGRVLPYLGTDLYANGTGVESFAMQLMKHSSSKRAIMWPGAGYSCKNAEQFKRSIAIGLIHADGIHMWTYTFCSKYRDANYFWRYGGTRPNFDDKRRTAGQNWYPWAWGIMQEMYKLAGDADKYLGSRNSTAESAILVSERTLINKSLSRGDIRRYWDNNLGIYSSVIKAGIPVDVCFVESLTPEKMKKYKVLVASDMQSIGSKEIDMIRSWVKNGGVLISSGATTLCDEWGRAQENFALGDVLGSDFKNWSEGGQNFNFSKIQMQYPSFENYASVDVRKKSRAVNWQLGKPALIFNRFGHGASYYFTAKNLGYRIRTSYNGCGFLEQMYPGFDKLICKIIKSKADYPVILKSLPEGVELQIQKNGDNSYIINLLDWHDNREVSGHSIQIKMPGKWRIIYPGSLQSYDIQASEEFSLRKFKIYQMIILKKEDSDK